MHVQLFFLELMEKCLETFKCNTKKEITKDNKKKPKVSLGSNTSKIASTVPSTNQETIPPTPIASMVPLPDQEIISFTPNTKLSTYKVGAGIVSLPEIKKDHLKAEKPKLDPNWIRKHVITKTSNLIHKIAVIHHGKHDFDRSKVDYTHNVDGKSNKTVTVVRKNLKAKDNVSVEDLYSHLFEFDGKS